MFSLTVFRRHFTPGLGMTLLMLLSVLLFVRLGFWQIQRGHDKADMLALQKEMMAKAPQLWTADQQLPSQYQPIRLRGHYGDSVFYLDNQHYQHQFGYDVISPFYIGNQLIVMVDRGWIPGRVDRKTLPQIQIPQGEQEIVGAVYFPSANWTLGPGSEPFPGRRWVIETLQPELFRQILQQNTAAFMMRLNPDQPDGFTRQWAIVSMPPERHYGYALQWFVMALAVLIIYVVLNLKKKL